MRRREFLAGIGSTAASPVVAHGQQSEQVRRVGVLMNAEDTQPFERTCVAAFTDVLRTLGWVEGRNLQIELRWNANDAERAKAYATELGSRLITPTMPGRQRDIQKRDNCVPVCHSGLRHV